MARLAPEVRVSGWSRPSGLVLDMVVLDTPTLPSKRVATCGNAARDRSVTFQVWERIVRHRLIAAGSQKVCGQRSNIVTGADQVETDHFLPHPPIAAAHRGRA